MRCVVWISVYLLILKLHTFFACLYLISEWCVLVMCSLFLFFLYIVRKIKFILHSFIIHLVRFWLSVPYSSLALVWLWCCCLFEEKTENFGIYPSYILDRYEKYASVFFPFYHWIFLIFIEIKVDLIRWYWLHICKFPVFCV